MPSTTTAEDPVTESAPISESIDRLSLEQAIRDVEVANARVIDLTARLTASASEIIELRGRLLALDTPTRSGNATLRLRLLVAPRVKAVARVLLPASVRSRLRAVLR